MTTPTVIERTRAALRTVLDPELGIDIVALGLIYDIRQEDGLLVVDMTLTTPGCPVSQSLPQEAARALDTNLNADESRDAEVRVVWDPPWTPERMEPGALDALRGGRG